MTESNRFKGLTIEGVYRPNRSSDPSFAFQIEWSAPQLGFGSVELYWDGNQLCANTEHMGPSFLEELLMLLSQQIKITE